MKAMKLQSNVQANSRNESAAPEWQYEQEKRKEKKAHKNLRNLKSTRKLFWIE